MKFIINEWLLEYLRLETCQNKRDTALKVISKLIEKKDIIVIRRPSRFLDKYYRYMKVYGVDIEFKNIFKGLNLLFRNSERTIFIDDSDCKLPIPMIFLKDPSDDYYLIEAAVNCSDSCIITTDARLKEALSDENLVKIILLDDFITEYL
jgi:predicted nucleic acid-binding protein